MKEQRTELSARQRQAYRIAFLLGFVGLAFFVFGVVRICCTPKKDAEMNNLFVDGMEKLIGMDFPAARQRFRQSYVAGMQKELSAERAAECSARMEDTQGLEGVRAPD